MSKPIFRGEIAPCDHELELYGDDAELLDRLAVWVEEGLARDESVVVIATTSHVEGLEARLRAGNVDLVAARLEDRFIPLSAERMLERFMRNEWPDDDAFADTVGQVVNRAREDGRDVRAFGEMVAILWERGHTAATVRLEYLWNQLLRTERFPLFCAYPRAGFTQRSKDSLSQICALHSRVIGLDPAPT